MIDISFSYRYITGYESFIFLNVWRYFQRLDVGVSRHIPQPYSLPNPAGWGIFVAICSGATMGAARCLPKCWAPSSEGSNTETKELVAGGLELHFEREAIIAPSVVSKELAIEVYTKDRQSAAPKWSKVLASEKLKCAGGGSQ